MLHFLLWKTSKNVKFFPGGSATRPKLSLKTSVEPLRLRVVGLENTVNEISKTITIHHQTVFTNGLQDVLVRRINICNFQRDRAIGITWHLLDIICHTKRTSNTKLLVIQNSVQNYAHNVLVKLIFKIKLPNFSRFPIICKIIMPYNIYLWNLSTKEGEVTVIYQWTRARIAFLRCSDRFLVWTRAVRRGWPRRSIYCLRAIADSRRCIWGLEETRWLLACRSALESTRESSSPPCWRNWASYSKIKSFNGISEFC